MYSNGTYSMRTGFALLLLEDVVDENNSEKTFSLGSLTDTPMRSGATLHVWFKEDPNTGLSLFPSVKQTETLHSLFYSLM